ncbi:nuclear transport factor 2 family protein [Mycolicibacterium boenickei]
MKVGVDVQSVLDTVDALDIEGFLNHLADDCEFRVGGAPPAVGHAAIAASVQGQFALVTSIEHSVDNVWRHANHIIVKGTLIYHRKAGSSVSVPFVNVWVLIRNKITRYAVYADLRALMN